MVPKGMDIQNIFQISRHKHVSMGAGKFRKHHKFSKACINSLIV